MLRYPALCCLFSKYILVPSATPFISFQPSLPRFPGKVTHDLHAFEIRVSATGMRLVV